MTADEITATVDPVRETATNINIGLDQGDLGLYSMQFTPGARVIDPIVPSLQPHVLDYFRMFRSLCTRWEMDEVFVNEGGALSVGNCRGFYAGFEAEGADEGDGLPDGLPAVRHLPMEDRQAVELMHRLQADVLADHGEATVRIIGFGASRAVDVSDQVATARAILTQFEEAWRRADQGVIGALYTDDAVRHDAYVGELRGAEAVGDWMGRLLASFPDVEVIPEGLYASGSGPALTYRLSMTTDGTACEMRMASVFDVNEAGEVGHEYVYYDPDTLLACNWAA